MNWNTESTRIFKFLWMANVLVFAAQAANADFVFGPTRNCGPNVNSAAYGEYGASVSADGLTLYFADGAVWDWHPDGYGDGDIWITTRKTLDDEWGPSQNLGPVINTSRLDGFPCISTDGLSLYFAAIRSSGFGDIDLYVSKRSALDAPWEVPVNLGPAVNGPSADVFPSVSSDGLILYFQSLRSGRGDIYMSTRTNTDEPFGPAKNIGSPINTPDQSEGAPGISPDGRMLFFSAWRAENFDIYVSRRAATDEPWSTPVNLGPPVSTPSPGDESGASFTADGTRFFFHGNHVIPDTVDVWEAEVFPIVDFNADGVVDCADVSEMIDFWGTDNTLYDIGPMPWGDGVVDAKDLLVLAEYMVDNPTDVNDVNEP